MGQRVKSIVDFGAIEGLNCWVPFCQARDALLDFNAQKGNPNNTWGVIEVPDGKWVLDKPVILPDRIRVQGRGRASVVTTSNVDTPAFIYGMREKTLWRDPNRSTTFQSHVTGDGGLRCQDHWIHFEPFCEWYDYRTLALRLQVSNVDPTAPLGKWPLIGYGAKEDNNKGGPAPWRLDSTSLDYQGDQFRFYFRCDEDTRARSLYFGDSRLTGKQTIELTVNLETGECRATQNGAQCPVSGDTGFSGLHFRRTGGRPLALGAQAVFPHTPEPLAVGSIAPVVFYGLTIGCENGVLLTMPSPPKVDGKLVQLNGGPALPDVYKKWGFYCGDVEREALYPSVYGAEIRDLAIESRGVGILMQNVMEGQIRDVDVRGRWWGVALRGGYDYAIQDCSLRGQDAALFSDSSMFKLENPKRTDVARTYLRSRGSEAQIHNLALGQLGSGGITTQQVLYIQNEASGYCGQTTVRRLRTDIEESRPTSPNRCLIEVEKGPTALNMVDISDVVTGNLPMAGPDRAIDAQVVYLTDAHPDWPTGLCILDRIESGLAPLVEGEGDWETYWYNTPLNFTSGGRDPVPPV